MALQKKIKWTKTNKRIAQKQKQERNKSMIFMLRRTVTFYSQKSFVGCIFVQCTLIVRHSNIHINDNRSTKNHTQNMKKKRKKHTQRKMLRSTLTIDESLGTLKKFTVLLDFGGPPSNYTRYKIRFRFFFFLISFFCFRFHLKYPS